MNFLNIVFLISCFLSVGGVKNNLFLRKTILSHFMFSSRLCYFQHFRKKIVVLASESVGGRSWVALFCIIIHFEKPHFETNFVTIL